VPVGGLVDVPIDVPPFKFNLHIRHRPCEKYRIICVLSKPYDLSTEEARQDWKKHYDAVVDLVGLPLDRACGSPECLFYPSRLPDRLVWVAREHVATVEGGPIVVADLPGGASPRHGAAA
jgi:hypothetical protein